MDVIRVTSHLVLYTVLTVAAIGDIWRMKISNRLIIIGLTMAFLFRVVGGQVENIVRFLPDIILPVVILYLLYLSGILGAGDIKLFSMIGGFTNLKETIWCMAAAFSMAALWAAIRLLVTGELAVRLTDGFLYFKNIFTGHFYKYESDSKPICFAVFVLLGVLFVQIFLLRFVGYSG